MIFAIALTGPTASGKSALGVKIARVMESEIISLDSMQIYRGMNIGTAKIKKGEMRGVSHSMIDIISPRESFSANDYRAMARDIAKRIYEGGRIPIFVGGTGLYLDTLMRAEIEGIPPADREYRDNILKNIKTDEDKIALHERLRAIDPISAEAVHPNNVRRVIRALEIYEKCGKPKSYFDELSKSTPSGISLLHLTLDFHNRDLLYDRIDRRVELMVEEGLFEEVRALCDGGELVLGTTAASGIGYKEIIEGERDGLERCEIIDKIKQASRNYAKRQLTWFRASEGAKVIYADDESGNIRGLSDILDEALGHIAAFPVYASE